MNIYSKRFIVDGKIKNVGYMNYIRRQALKLGLHRYIQKNNDNKMEVTLYGQNEQVLDDFKDICYKGSKKSRVKNVSEFASEMSNDPFKLGFEIIT